MLSADTRAHISKIAREMDLQPSTLLAVVEVESGGKTNALIDNQMEPLIRFEGHYFHRLLSGGQRTRAVNAGLAHPRAGRIKNPRGQSRRWVFLRKAIRINRIAALSSVSWGIGQVMGSHWRWLGYGSVDALVQEARSGIAGQVRLMVRFIKKSGLTAKLQARDWAGFAKGYNGPAYAKNQYDKKMAAAYARYLKQEATKSTTIPGSANKEHPLLRRGSNGIAVKLLQQELLSRGYNIKIDGDFGPETLRAVRKFQSDNALVTDGIVGDATWVKLKTKSKNSSSKTDRNAMPQNQFWFSRVAGLFQRIFNL